MISRKKVYAAGGIKGLSWADAVLWREDLAKALGENVQVLSPMRSKSYLVGENEIKDSYDDFTLSTGKGITTRDRWDVMTCDVVFMNLLGLKKVSIGTMIEVGWADAFRKPLIVVMDDKNIHDHAMVKEIAGFTVKTFDEGVMVCRALLCL
jgi:nucleoside 2-deoxyribosyltransferase